MIHAEEMQRIANQYAGSGEPWPATARQIATWAIRNGLWEPHPASLVGQCASELSKAMREEYTVDPQGRTVRAKHAAMIKRDGEQLTFVWADIRTASRDHMMISLQQRRQKVFGECRQLKIDVDSYNQNAGKGLPPIQMVFDFRQDLEELEMVTRRPLPSGLRRPSGRSLDVSSPKASPPVPSLPSGRPAGQEQPPPGSSDGLHPAFSHRLLSSSPRDRRQ